MGHCSTRKDNKVKLPAKYMVAGATFFFAITQMASADSAKHLSASESIAAAVSKPQPEYSAIARQLKLAGEVVMNAYVSEDGNVEKVEAVSGNPVLARSAKEALMKWKFNKQTEDGKPVKVVANVSFNFKKQ